MNKTEKTNSAVNKPITILGVPSCLGGSEFGCQEGPAAIRKVLMPMLKKHGIPYRDIGDIEAPKLCVITDTHAKCLKEIRVADDLLGKKIRQEKLFGSTGKASFQALFLVLLGGDHSLNYAFILEARKKHKPLGLIWFDAHADFNTPEITPSGNVHGMVLAGLAKKIGEKNIVIFGVRDMDPEEKTRLHKSKVTVITMDEIKKKGIEKSLQKAFKALSKTKAIHLSFDLDFFDPSIAPGTGTPVKKGLSASGLKILMQTLRKLKSPPIISADIMELNPLKDKYNKTARLAAQIIIGLANLSK